MKALVMFDSVHGNTEQTARAVAAVLGRMFSVQAVSAEKMAKKELRDVDLLVVGGPTHRHRRSRRLAAVFASMPRKALHGIQVAAFDTRYRMPAWFAGSAAGEIGRKLRKLGTRLILPPESFFVARDIPPKGSKRRHNLERMEPGELEWAGAWAAEVGKASAIVKAGNP
ncbi:MAG: flavodoxin domain-containing protein [Anaerolineales bacterium]|nr:flavodoxin domain-containing protein [Anaerolineales bacterium]